jgi:hypothetical protein
MDRLSRQKKMYDDETSELSYTIDKMTLANICRIFHSGAIKCTSAHGTFSTINHVLGHITSFMYSKKLRWYYVTHLTTME